MNREPLNREPLNVSVADPAALQAAADRIDPRRIQERLDYWTFMLGPKFAQHERDGMDLRRYYFISQVEHAQNIIFKRNHPIHSIFERSCDLGLARITTARIANIFGWRITKRTKGKHQAVLQAHQLTPDQYTRNQLAYDLRKLKAHGLIERPDNRYVYVLSNYGRKAACLCVPHADRPPCW